MKQQNDHTIKAHLIRSTLYVLLLLAVCLIPFALAQRSAPKERAANRPEPLPQSSIHTSGPAGACTDYTTSTSTDTIVPGTTDIGNHCDDCTTNITFPFPINLYGSTFTTGDVGANGNLQFGGAVVYFGSTCPLPNTSLGEAIFPYQDDLSTDPAISPDCSMFASGCGVFTSVSGTAPNRVFNIEWRTGYFGRAGTANFELRFYEDNPSCFDVIYGSTVDNGMSEVSGVQESAAGPGATTFSCHEATLTEGLGVTYCCGGGTPTPTPSASATETPSATPSPTASATATPTETPSTTPTASPSGTPSVTPTPTGTPVGCVFGQGYWKNHPDAWPVTTLDLGTVTYDQQQLLDILHEPVRGNGLLILAHQLIAAKLNIAAGADPSCVQQTIEDADALIGDLVVPPVGTGYLAPRDAAPLAGILGQFNEGGMCAPACEGGPGPSGTPHPRGRPGAHPRPH